MNKTRIETLTDGVFAIVMTLLVLDIKLPELAGTVSDSDLWISLSTLWPIFTSFVLSFLVLTTFWISHNFLFNTRIKEVDRALNLYNMLYLFLVVLVPFSAHLFGAHHISQPAALVYGLNILAAMFVMRIMVQHVRRNEELAHEVPSRLIKQSNIRTLLSIVSYTIGIAFSYIYIPASIFFYIFPLIFNIIPGSLNALEHIFGFNIT